MTVPIVFIHRGSGGDFNYLNYAALQARLSNPDTAIYVIGDQAALESLVVPAVELIPLEGLADSGLPLRSVYEHYRVNSAEYTLFCMERWFYLRAFMEREGFQRALHLDCDVMLYKDVSKELGAVFDTCDLTLSLGHSTHTTSIRLTAVDRLCELMLATYRDSSKLGEIRDRWTKAEASGERWEGVGDMYFIKQLGLESDLVVRETYQGHDPVFDGNIRQGIGYEMEGGIKKIVFKEGRPYGFREVDGREQRFATLHFQYTAKQHMPHFLHAPPGSQVPGEFLANALRVLRWKSQPPDNRRSTAFPYPLTVRRMHRWLGPTQILPVQGCDATANLTGLAPLFLGHSQDRAPPSVGLVFHDCCRLAAHPAGLGFWRDLLEGNTSDMRQHVPDYPGNGPATMAVRL